ncbi:hypothetical protein SBD_5442 [Streptomyces bottropensis ATCC 25435]|uniref:Uncharacterized protein n=1 Tax=Streptomyces bottropensis ATCC 25435 TaxID=1054862 RepID=M3EXI2_9ACTN|nr:hypothetical protein SBD_5442 [Streptomyces bottropensis ATCC 25435]
MRACVTRPARPRPEPGYAGEGHSEVLVLLSMSPPGALLARRRTPGPGGGMADALA